MALIKDLAQLRPHLPVAYANVAKNLPAFEDAEAKRVVPIIGETLYTSLQQHFDAETTTPDENALLLKCRAVIAPFAYLENLPFMQTQLTDNGLTSFQSEHARSAFRWEYEAAREALSSRGYAALETLITFMRVNASIYPEWQNSAYNDPLEFGTIRSGDDLRKVFALQLQQPQRVYGIIKPIFNTIQELYLEPALGQEFYAVLNARLLTDLVSGEDVLLMKKLRPAAAYFAMKHAASVLAIRISDAGFTVTDGSRLKDTSNEGTAQAGELQIQRFIEEMERTGQHFLTQALKYLNETCTDQIFPEFKVSSLYVDPSVDIGVARRNDTRRGFFVAG